jgi:HK97 family phage portal protein
MGFLARAVAEQKSMSSHDLFREIYGGRPSKAGPNVNLEAAFKQATVFACLKVLSQGCAQVPFKLFREFEEGGLTKIKAARELPLYDLVATKPNDWQTSFEFREQLVLHAALGNAYVWKNRLPSGKIAELILLDPFRMAVEKSDDFSNPRYKYTLKDGKTILFSADVIWHVRGPSWTGFAGMELLTMAREALGLAIATEETHASLHAKGVRPSGTYSIDGTLTPQQYKDLKAWIEAEMAGADNAGAPMILDRGAKWLESAMTGLDAEHLATRNYQGAEICRFLGVLPSKVGFTDKTATYASAEQFAIQHVVDTMGPWYARIEQSADVNLLTEKERAAGLYFKFMAGGLLRGAAKDRAEYYAKALGSGGSPGWMVPDEIRLLEELNPMGGEAAKLPVPSNKPSSPESTPA